MKRDKQIIKDFFSRQVRTFKDSVHSLAWESDYTQRVRFAVLTEIADLDGSRILDVGCGKADLYSFLCEHDCNVEYYGIDLTRELIDIAKKKHPGLSLFYRDFLDDKRYPEIDYAVSSGVANIRTPKNRHYFTAILKKMFTIAKKGVAINMLSSYSPDDKRDSSVYLYDPELMLKSALKLTPKVILRHDYLPNDFTLYLYKSGF